MDLDEQNMGLGSHHLLIPSSHHAIISPAHHGVQEMTRGHESPKPMGRTPRHTIGPGVWNQELDR